MPLVAFMMGEVEEGVEALDRYRMVYGRDPDWVELRYRHGEAMRVLAPAAAHDTFTGVTTGYSASPWAGEAQRQLEALARGGAS